MTMVREREGHALPEIVVTYNGRRLSPGQFGAECGHIRHSAREFGLMRRPTRLLLQEVIDEAVDFLWRAHCHAEGKPARLRLLEDKIAAAIALLDGIDGDPDFEPDDGEEPTLGWTDHQAAFGVPLSNHWARISRCEDGEAEPALGWTDGEAAQGVPFAAVEDGEAGDDTGVGDRDALRLIEGEIHPVSYTM